MLNKNELAIAHAIRDTKYASLESLAGESLVTACWVMNVIIENAKKELSLINPLFEFEEFNQESSIEDE